MCQHLELRNTAPQEAGQQEPQIAGNQQHGRQPKLFLTLRRGCGFADQRVSQAGLDAGVVATAGDRLLQDALSCGSSDITCISLPLG